MNIMPYPIVLLTVAQVKFFLPYCQFLCADRFPRRTCLPDSFHWNTMWTSCFNPLYFCLWCKSSLLFLFASAEQLHSFEEGLHGSTSAFPCTLPLICYIWDNKPGNSSSQLYQPQLKFCLHEIGEQLHLLRLIVLKPIFYCAFCNAGVTDFSAVVVSCSSLSTLVTQRVSNFPQLYLT